MQRGHAACTRSHHLTHPEWSGPELTRAALTQAVCQGLLRLRYDSKLPPHPSAHVPSADCFAPCESYNSSSDPGEKRLSISAHCCMKFL